MQINGYIYAYCYYTLLYYIYRHPSPSISFFILLQPLFVSSTCISVHPTYGVTIIIIAESYMAETSDNA